jgi:hypothetical protein
MKEWQNYRPDMKKEKKTTTYFRPLISLYYDKLKMFKFLSDKIMDWTQK